MDQKVLNKTDYSYIYIFYFHYYIIKENFFFLSKRLFMKLAKSSYEDDQNNQTFVSETNQNSTNTNINSSQEGPFYLTDDPNPIIDFEF
jgi:hypothetical protein